MSGWTILTLRAREGQNYKFSQYDGTDPYDATSDIAQTMEEDDRVRKWTTWSSHVYAYLATSRYDWEYAEEIIDDYRFMVRDAVVLGANDTTDTGTARYYVTEQMDNGKVFYTDEYQETEVEDGTFVGEMALCVINSRHGIMSRDPFHNPSGTIDDAYLSNGESRSEEFQ